MGRMSTRAAGPSVELLSARMASAGWPAQAWGNGPGDRYAVHEHAYDKVIVTAAGSISFTLPGTGTTLELVAGDRLDLPAGTAHGAVVGPDGVTCLEAHAARGTLSGPPRRHAGWGSGPALDVAAETAPAGTA